MGKSPVKVAEQTAWRWYAKYMRLKRAIEEMGGTGEFARCVTCDKVIPLAKGDAAHYVPGRAHPVLFVEDNVHVSCVPCNRFKQGMWVPYRDYMLETYGAERTREIERLFYDKWKYTEDELRGIANYYRVEFKKLSTSAYLEGVARKGEK